MLVSREGAGAPTVRRTEWSSDQEGLQQRAQLETTHWNAPQHSYGKVVAGMAVRSGGHAVHAHRQVEVMSARAPGVLRVLRASVTTSHSSSTTTQGHRHFDDLQLSVNPLDISSQRERSSVGRSGALGGRRPPSRGRPLPAPQPSPREGLERLMSPAIVASGVSKLSSNVDIVEMKSDSDKHSTNSDDKKYSETKYKVNYPDNESEESFYDSCPEKDSIFKDESDQLEEWRRSSKIRRSLQFPRRSPAGGKPLDLPDNWGSVSRIKRELESGQNIALFPKNKYHSLFSTSSSDNCVIREEETEVTNAHQNDENISENFLIKPSTLKSKSFISLEALNQVRGRLKTLSTEAHEDRRETHQSAEKDDGIEAEVAPTKTEDISSSEPKVTRVRSYVFGMEAMLNALNEKKPNSNYPGGSNSLESRVSKLASSSASRSDDWYMRRKSYGFEKVGNKSEYKTLTSHDKNSIESSTDSGICQSSELVNSLSNGATNPNTNRSTIVNLGSSEKRETFENWLQKNRKTFATNIHNGTNKYKCLQDDSEKINSNESEYSPPSASVHIPVRSEDSLPGNNNRQLFYRQLSEGTTLSVESSPLETSVKSPATPFAFKRHTIAVDGIKEIRDLYEPQNTSITKTFFSALNTGSKTEENSEDSTEKKGKKVEFCKTEVHFTAESGRVNIVESEGKPPSTNNFRRRRRSNPTPSVKETDKKLPITRFGDNMEENKIQGVDEGSGTANEKLKLNYAVITEIKSTAKESPNQNDKKDAPSIVQINGDLTEGDQPRGILKNKPIKPRPYLLGEDPEAHTETGENTEQNLWGVKLRPVKRLEEPSLWKSSVLLNNNQTDDIQNECAIKQLGDSLHKMNKEVCLLSSVDETSKMNKALPMTNNKLHVSSTAPLAEPKGYSTKVNFGNDGDAIIETSFRQLESKHDFVKSEDCLVRSNERITNISCINRTNPRENKGENVTTKISIDVSPMKQTTLRRTKTSIDGLSELKSTALVKNTVSNVEANSNMVLIGESDRCFVKTAYKSKLCELRKMYESKECSEDSADEEVRSLMGRSGGLSWGSLRGAGVPGAQAAPTGSLSWSRRRAQRTALPGLTAISRDTKPFANNPINYSQLLSSKGYKEIFDDGRKATGPLPDRTNTSALGLQHSTFQKNHIVTEKKQIFDKNVANHNGIQIESSANIPKILDPRQVTDDKTVMSTFADSISTPRSLMPARGSARKLKEHELSYFGVKDAKAKEVTSSKSVNSVESKIKVQQKQTTRVQNTSAVSSVYTKSNYATPIKIQSSEVKTGNPQITSPIYENIVINSKDKISETKTAKVKHPGESIIEELTKAADEILQALNGYSDEESSQLSSDDDDPKSRRNKKKVVKPLETISETYSHKVKALENKAVQADLGSREKNKSYLLSGRKVASKNSSNSSIESVVRESRSATHRIKSATLERATLPEKPQRKKVSSVEAVKARRLHRANSRDALFQIHGSSSEDLPGNTLDVVKKKTSRRSRYGEMKSSNMSINTHSSAVEEVKYPSRSLTTVLPEIRHKTAISTIKAVGDRSASKDKSSSKTKSSTKERSRRREKLQEGTISSLNRIRVLPREKSRSADTSLDRENGHPRERLRTKDSASYHGDECHDPIKVRHLSSHHRNSSQSKLKIKETHDESHEKLKVSSSLQKDKISHKTLYEKDGAHDKIRVRDPPSDHGERTHEHRMRVRESSLHRRDRSQDKAPSRHGDRHDDREKARESSSHRRDRSKDKHRERESSQRRDRSQDSGRFRTPEIKYDIVKKKNILPNSSIVGGTGGRSHEGVGQPGGGAPPRVGPTHTRATHTRTEHDKSLR